MNVSTRIVTAFVTTRPYHKVWRAMDGIGRGDGRASYAVTHDVTHDVTHKAYIGSALTCWSAVLSYCDTRIAARFGRALLLGTQNGVWQTKTTRRRINDIAWHYHVPTIVQSKGVWSWSDGVPYTGARLFILD